MEGLEEAQNELILVDDDDAARYLFGLCFVHTPNDDADSRITKGACLQLAMPTFACQWPASDKS
jgi:hypothetical protein